MDKRAAQLKRVVRLEPGGKLRKLMRREELEGLIHLPESQTLEWKADFPGELRGDRRDAAWERGKGTVVKDVSAMANSLEGGEGVIVYGVKDHRTHREVLGISRSWDSATLQGWIRNAVEPNVNADYSEVLWEEGRAVGVFRIWAHPEAPHVAVRTLGNLHAGQVWLRVGTQNTIALHQELERLFAPPEPMISDSTSGPVAIKAKEHYRQLGRELIFPNCSKRDDRLAEGYELAFYPGTRRPIVLRNPVSGQDELIAMVKPLEAG